MTLDVIDPQDLPTAPTYTQVIVASGSRIVFVPGQVAQDSEGNVVAPGDPAGPPVRSRSQDWVTLRLVRIRGSVHEGGS